MLIWQDADRRTAWAAGLRRSIGPGGGSFEFTVLQRRCGGLLFDVLVIEMGDTRQIKGAGRKVWCGGNGSVRGNGKFRQDAELREFLFRNYL